MSKLSAKQSRFIEEYLIDLNATQAAIRAGYSEKTAGSQAHDLLKKPEIAQEVQDAKRRRSEATGITQERVLKELARIGFSDVRKTLSSGGGLIDPQDWDDDTAAAISSLEVVTVHRGDEDEDGNKIPERVHKIRSWDKLSALEKLARHLGMLDGNGASGEDAPSLAITISTKTPVADVRVTRPNC